MRRLKGFHHTQYKATGFTGSLGDAILFEDFPRVGADFAEL